jgi:hypothetical protein
MKRVAKDKPLADQVGLNGYEMGYNHFHFEKYVDKMKAFFS